MSVDHGTSIELQPLRHRCSEIVDALGFSSAVQSGRGSLVVKSNASTNTLATCGLALSGRMMTPEDSIPGRLFSITLCSLTSVWVYRSELLETSGCLNASNADPCMSKNAVNIIFPADMGHLTQPAFYDEYPQRLTHFQFTKFITVR
ncbi:hypothetical protein TNCV_3527141 [Trichonephila clavipes]|nr:hypothetical protein TNCV_3527141 [Trichonephila clavipes]